MHTEVLKYQADGRSMESHLYVGDGAGKRPGVLVFPEAFGISDHSKSRAEKLARLGYVALACDLHGEGGFSQDMAKVGAMFAELQAAPQRISKGGKASLEVLAARPEVDPSRIAAIGYCFGGTMSLELARNNADIKAAVGFHSGLNAFTPNAQNIKSKVLVCLGADDPSITVENRAAFEAEMKAAGADWQIHVYGGVVHSFTNPGADALGQPAFAKYDAKADARSEAAMLGLLKEAFA